MLIIMKHDKIFVFHHIIQSIIMYSPRHTFEQGIAPPGKGSKKSLIFTMVVVLCDCELLPPPLLNPCARKSMISLSKDYIFCRKG